MLASRRGSPVVARRGEHTGLAMYLSSKQFPGCSSPPQRSLNRQRQGLRSQPEHKENLWKIASALQEGLRAEGFDLGVTNSCVTPVFLSGGLGEATNLTLDLRENYGIFCSIVVYPVVPKDTIMLRLIPTAIHTLEDVQYTIETFTKVKDKLFAGEYKSEEIASWA